MENYIFWFSLKHFIKRLFYKFMCVCMYACFCLNIGTYLLNQIVLLLVSNFRTRNNVCRYLSRF